VASGSLCTAARANSATRPIRHPSYLAGFLRKMIAARSWQTEGWPAIKQLVTVIRWFDGRAAKTSTVADRPMLVIELARVVWRDTVAVLESDDGCDGSTPRPVDDGCDDSMRRPCSEYEARAFLASELDDFIHSYGSSIAPKMTF
jgi:hypothetical protein